MSGDVNVVQRTQRLLVDSASKTVNVINAGPIGPGVGGGPGTSGVTDTELAAEVAALEAADDALAALIALVVPSGYIGATLGIVEPTGWVFDNQTIVNCQSLHPGLWANTPASMHVGSDLVIPDLSSKVMMFSSGTPGALGGAMSRTITANNLPTHTHAVGTLGMSSGGSHTHTASSGVESQGHVHYLSGGSVGGWAPTAGMGGATANHLHGPVGGTTDYLFRDDAYETGWTGAWMQGGGPPAITWAGSTNWQNADHSHNLSGYVTGAHQQHTHTITVNSTNSSHTHTLTGATGNNTTTATALDTTPAHITVRAIIKI